MELKPVRLRKVREDRGLSRAQLARNAVLQPTLITWIEQGRYIPYPKELERLADALDVKDFDTLLEPLGGDE